MSAPALEPVEERILQDLETTLGAIATTSMVAEFYTDVRKVHAMDKVLGQNVETPSIIVHHLGTTHTFHAAAGGDGGLFESTINLELYCILARTGPTWRRDLVRFAADVRRAVMVDPHRGNVSGQANAFDCLVGETAIAPLVDGHNGPAARLTLQIQFRDYVNDPTLSA